MNEKTIENKTTQQSKGEKENVIVAELHHFVFAIALVMIGVQFSVWFIIGSDDIQILILAIFLMAMAAYLKIK